ncbi:MAG: hypothetical protein HN877_13625 [Rhodospirillaceae bacterium]|nr:hypothetical protein [Rhodospirillaceae bacterium]
MSPTPKPAAPTPGYPRSPIRCGFISFFFAYSTIAIGLGRLFGIELPVNFLTPYQAPNPRTFWRRWHVTLSLWLRDYIYIPLGGNASYVRNIMIVFAVCGLWHGAQWNFVIWGLYYAALVLIYTASRPAWDRLSEFLQRLMCFTLVTLGWPLFYLDLGQYITLLGVLMSPSTWWFGVYYPLTDVALVGGVAMLTVFPEFIGQWPRRLMNKAFYFAPVQVSAIVIAIMFFHITDTFIYFRF